MVSFDYFLSFFFFLFHRLDKNKKVTVLKDKHLSLSHSSQWSI